MQNAAKPRPRAQRLIAKPCRHGIRSSGRPDKKLKISLDIFSALCYYNKAVADVAHLVERHLAKVEVASSSLVIRSKRILPIGGVFFILWIKGMIDLLTWNQVKEIAEKLKDEMGTYKIDWSEDIVCVVYRVDRFDYGGVSQIDRHIDIECSFGEYYEIGEESALFQWIRARCNLPLWQENQETILYQKPFCHGTKDNVKK